MPPSKMTCRIVTSREFVFDPAPSRLFPRSKKLKIRAKQGHQKKFKFARKSYLCTSLKITKLSSTALYNAMEMKNVNSQTYATERFGSVFHDPLDFILCLRTLLHVVCPQARKQDGSPCKKFR
jgi:hypothetical protein